MNSLAKDLGKSLAKNSIPVSVEFLENGIDGLISNNVLRDVPILNSIGAVIRTGKDLHERNLLKQTSAFLVEFNSGAIDEEKLQKYKEKLEDDKEKASELERVLLILNNNIDVEKSKYLAKLFTAYINEKITWDEFCEFSDITNRFYMEDYRILRMFWDNRSTPNMKAGDEFRAERIYSAGIVGINPAAVSNGAHVVHGRKLNHLGKTYCDIIFGGGDS